MNVYQFKIDIEKITNKDYEHIDSDRLPDITLFKEFIMGFNETEFIDKNKNSFSFGKNTTKTINSDNNLHITISSENKVSIFKWILGVIETSSKKSGINVFCFDFPKLDVRLIENILSKDLKQTTVSIIPTTQTNEFRQPTNQEIALRETNDFAIADKSSLDFEKKNSLELFNPCISPNVLNQLRSDTLKQSLNSYSFFSKTKSVDIMQSASYKSHMSRYTPKLFPEIKEEKGVDLVVKGDQPMPTASETTPIERPSVAILEVINPDQSLELLGKNNCIPNFQPLREEAIVNQKLVATKPSLKTKQKSKAQVTFQTKNDVKKTSNILRKKNEPMSGFQPSFVFERQSDEKNKQKSQHKPSKRIKISNLMQSFSSEKSDEKSKKSERRNMGEKRESSKSKGKQSHKDKEHR